MKRSPMPARSGPMARTPFARTAPTIRTVAAVRRARDTGPDQKTRNIVLERDGYACVCCGVSIHGRPYSLQHRKRRSHGVDNSPPNLLTVLGDGTTGCHARIDSRIDPHDEEKGYTVRSWDDPALVPVMVFSSSGSGVTMWPTADGRWVPESLGCVT
jgi:hypothetical protein